MNKSYSGPDRRRYMRIPAKDLLSHEPLAVKSFDLEGVHKKYVNAKDLGEGGLLFQSDVLFPIGTYLKLQFFVHDWEKHKIAFYKEEDVEKGPFTVIGKVVRDEILGPARFEIGIEFIAVDMGHRQALRDYVKKLRPNA
jgi:hypothetical protein